MLASIPAFCFWVCFMVVTSRTSGNELILDPEDLPFWTDPPLDLQTTYPLLSPSHDSGSPYPAIGVSPDLSALESVAFNNRCFLTESCPSLSHFVTEDENGTGNTNFAFRNPRIAFTHELVRDCEPQDPPLRDSAQPQENSPNFISALVSDTTDPHHVHILDQSLTTDHDRTLSKSLKFGHLTRDCPFEGSKNGQDCYMKPKTGNPSRQCMKRKHIEFPTNSILLSGLEDIRNYQREQNQSQNRPSMVGASTSEVPRNLKPSFPPEKQNESDINSMQAVKKIQRCSPSFPRKFFFDDNTFDCQSSSDPIDKHISKAILNLMKSPLTKRLFINENDFRRIPNIIWDFRKNLEVIYQQFDSESTALQREKRNRIRLETLSNELHDEKEKWFSFWGSVIGEKFSISIPLKKRSITKAEKILLCYLFYVAMIDTIVSTQQRQLEERYEANLIQDACKAFHECTLLRYSKGILDGGASYSVNALTWIYLKHWIMTSGHTNSRTFMSPKLLRLRKGWRILFDYIFQYSIQKITKRIGN